MKSARGRAHSGTLTRRIVLLAVATGTPVFAQTNSEPTNALPKMFPPYAELPPTFWEQHGTAILLIGVGAIALTTLIVWWRLRPKSVVVLPPEVQARTALESLRQRPEEGACLSHVSQILRRYFLAAFQLPPGEPTTAEFCQMLACHAQVGGELLTAVAEFLHRCDEQKFSRESQFENSLAQRRPGLGVPPLGGSPIPPPEGGTPKQDDKSTITSGAVEQALALIAQAEARRAPAEKPEAPRA